MDEVITIRVPEGTRDTLEELAHAANLTLDQYVCRALQVDQLLDTHEKACLDMLLQARAHDIYTDEDVFKALS